MSVTQTKSTPAGLCTTLTISSQRQGAWDEITEENQSQERIERKDSEASLVSASSKIVTNAAQPNPCGRCRKPINDEDLALECETCNQSFHIQCENVNKTQYKCIDDSNKGKGKAKSRVHWYCNTCDLVTVDWRNTMAALHSNHQKLDKKVEYLKEEIKKKADKDDVKKLEERIVRVEEKQKKAEEKPTTSYATPNDMLRELKEREARLNNAVFFKVPESKATKIEDKIKEDCQLLKEIGKICQESIEDDDIVKVKRLGKKGENPRPMLVTFNEDKDKDKKRKLFRNLQKLKEGPDNLKEVSGQHDFTVQQREEEKKLREDAKKKEEESGEYSFRVRGPTWARKVVQIKKITPTNEVKQQQQS